MVEVLNRFDVSISQISPRGLKRLVGIIVMGFEQGVNLSADHLVALLGLYRTSTNHFFAFKPRHFMEIIKCFSNDSSRWREYFFSFV